MAPRFFDLQPTFFAGEPTEDIGGVVVPQPANLLTIRMQRNGNRIEINDTLYFDVLNSYEVARCVRGQTKNGVPQWDHAHDHGLPRPRSPTNTPWCDWSGTAQVGDGGASDAGGRSDGGDAGAVPVGDAPRGASTSPPRTWCTRRCRCCSPAIRRTLVGVAFDGTIEFQDFGSAAQNNLPPDMRDPMRQ